MVTNQKLVDFTAEVNRLEHARCARINATSTSLFSAQHHDYPTSMMTLYFDKGWTPQEYVNMSEHQNKADGRAEALAS